jgi:hypothetical protein
MRRGERSRADLRALGTAGNVPPERSPATLQASAARLKQRLDDVWTARSRDWHAIEVAADDLAVAAALVLEAAGEQRDLSENVG